MEYALALKAQAPVTFVISLANGELQGDIATEAMAIEGATKPPTPYSPRPAGRCS